MCGPQVPTVPISIIGATASGKSALAMTLAREFDLEIVSADAFQVYRGLDIGTAKASRSERDEITHHLIDLVDVDEEFTVADFAARYRAVTAMLGAGGRRGLLVGGTGLYQRIVVDDLELPGQWPEARQRLEESAALVGPEVLYEELARLDPVAATKMEPTNTRRIVRALEVIEGSGRPFSSFGPGFDHYPSTSMVQIGLRWPRPLLAERIAARVQVMIETGFVDEVRSLPPIKTWSRTARQALGYREIDDVIAGRCSLPEAVEAISLRTRQLAVRQERWFRRDPRIRWVDMGDESTAAVVALVRRVLGESLSE